MMSNRSVSVANRRQTPIQRLVIKGYKSIRGEQTLEIRPLTLLAGANSAGKSSVMQPLLLLKQTLEATYDPGPLLLDGPNVKFTKASQLFFKGKGGVEEKDFMIGLGIGDSTHNFGMYFSHNAKASIQLKQMDFIAEGKLLTVSTDMTEAQIAKLLAEMGLSKEIQFDLIKERSVIRDRCFLGIRARGLTSFGFMNITPLIDTIRAVIHVPGLRGNPTRTYPVTAVGGSAFPGTFEYYTASVIAQWGEESKTESGTKNKNLPKIAQGSSGRNHLKQLGKSLEKLGLTWKVQARKLDDTRVELQVGRTTRSTRSGAKDMVNVADVGFGVSQTLPVLVALQVARPGQIVYLEQPEIHLHPRAQVAMAGILADAANRGVVVVAETHSALLLLGVQTLIAEGKLDPKKVKLHWFTRDEEGETHITPADPDKFGSFGDWPQDFDDITLSAQSAYLDAVDTLHTRSGAL